MKLIVVGAVEPPGPAVIGAGVGFILNTPADAILVNSDAPIVRTIWLIFI